MKTLAELRRRAGGASLLGTLEDLVRSGDQLAEHAITHADDVAAQLMADQTVADEFGDPAVLSAWLRSLRGQLGTRAPAAKTAEVPIASRPPLLNEAELTALQEGRPPLLGVLEALVVDRCAAGDTVDADELAAALMSTAEGAGEFDGDSGVAAAWLRSLGARSGVAAPATSPTPAEGPAPAAEPVTGRKAQLIDGAPYRKQLQSAQGGDKVSARLVIPDRRFGPREILIEGSPTAMEWYLDPARRDRV